MDQPETLSNVMPFALLPALGEAWEGGIFCGITTATGGQHQAVVLLPAKPDKRLAWPDAMAWAEIVGGSLPTRPVAALLFANAKPQFEEAWHWTCEADADDSSYAWYQTFYDGFQSNFHKSYGGRARAVRLIQLTA
jgi:hypothetical protein